MIRKITIILALIIAGKSFGQMSKQLAPVNPELIDYYNNKKMAIKAAKVVMSDEKTTGYIPPYVQLPEYYDNTNESTMKSLSLPNLPARFDLRDSGLVTSVKNQGSGNFGGNCWAFACLSSIESCWLSSLTSLGTTDLSEQSMATCHGYGWGFGQGGNEYFPMAYLTTLKGPISDSLVRYDTEDTAKQHCESGYKPIAYFPETRWIYNNPVLTKKVIMDYGAVATNIYWDNKNYNAAKCSYYANDRNGANHAISIVGWDDNKVTHVGTGAWIAKNSWTTSWGDHGYFYIAYGDNHILRPASFYPTIVPTSNIDTLFKKESIGVVSYFGYQADYAYSLVKYNAPNEITIRRVGSFLTKTGSSLEIEIYSDSLQTLVNSYKSQPVLCPGFYTYEIPAIVVGDFFVKIKYYTPGINRPIPIEIKAEVLGEMYADPFIQPSGTQWVSENGNNWQALGSDIKGWESNLIAHVYASYSSLPIANFETDKFEVCTGGEITFTSKAFGNITTQQWNFGEGANPAYGAGPGPHVVNYPVGTPEGVKYAMMKVVGPDGSNIKSKPIKVVSSLTTLIGAPDYIKMNDSAKLTAIVDADSYLWYPSEELTDSISKVVYFKSKATGLHKFTLIAKQGDCSGSYTVNVNLKQPPINDEVCNAIALQTGQNGPFTNRGATAEFNEPAPADTSCYDDMSWCKEGGLQNSVWFKVIGPSNGKLSLDTKGMDTQIAVYQSDTCTNIKKEDMIAANDDYYSEDLYYAAAIDEISVIPGKTYWVQIDGSAGGDEGDFYIAVSDAAIEINSRWPLNVNSAVMNNSCWIFPNPSNGSFNVQYLSTINEELYITVTDLTGKTILKTNKLKQSGLADVLINIPGLQKGVYLVNVQSSIVTKTLKCIIQ
jgi:C1A family cysteine protease